MKLIPQSKIGMTLWSVFWVLIALAWVSIPAFATGSKDKDPTIDQNQGQAQGQLQGQAQGQSQNASSDQSQRQSLSSSQEVTTSAMGVGGAANNEGNSLSVSSNYEASAPDVILVPNNNTVDCHKVYGISFSNTSGGGGIGWPYRDKSCDYEQAASAASAVGDHELAWYWRCHKKNLYKPFKDRGESKEKAIRDCHSEMVGQVSKSNRIAILEDQIEDLNALREIETSRHNQESADQKARCNERVNRVVGQWSECQKSGK